MKTKLITAAAFAICLATAGMASAETPDLRSNMGDLTACQTKSAMPSFSDMDIDRDGRINYRELKTADKKDLSLFEGMDEDRDGFLSKTEMTEHTADRGCVN